MSKWTDNNRISPRKKIRTRVIFEDERSDDFLYFLSTDISLSGIFIESNIPLKLGTKLFLKFALYEGETPLQITGEVARIMVPKRGRGRRKKGQLFGIGIHFVGPPAETLKKIERFIQN